MATVAHDLGLSERGYRMVSSQGRDGRQQVSHFHVELLGGAPLPAVEGRPREEADALGVPATLATSDAYRLPRAPATISQAFQVNRRELTLVLEPVDEGVGPSATQVHTYAALLGIGAPDAARKLRCRLPWVVARGVPPDVRGMADALHGAGLRPRTFETRRLLEELEPWRVEQANWEDGVLELSGPEGEARLHLDDPHRLIKGAYAYVPRQTSGPLQLQTSGRKRSVTGATQRPELSTIRFLHLYPADRARPYCLAVDRLRDWSFLGDAMQPSAIGNLEALFEQLAAAPGVTADLRLQQAKSVIQGAVAPLWAGVQPPEVDSPDVHADVASRLLVLCARSD